MYLLLLIPCQLGFGVCGGIEAVIHVASHYIHHLLPGHAVVKLDFKNAFNSVRRDKMLDTIRVLAPEIYQFVYSALHLSSGMIRFSISWKVCSREIPWALSCSVSPST